jgi:hypothetical protein
VDSFLAGDRIEALPRSNEQVSDRSFFLWYTARSGKTFADCIHGISVAQMRRDAREKLDQFWTLDASLQARERIRGRADGWRELADTALGRIQSRDRVERIQGLEAQRIEIDGKWRLADEKLQRELKRQKRLQREAGYLAVMGLALDSAKLASQMQNNFSDQATSDGMPAIQAGDSRQLIYQKINDKLLESESSITRIRQEIRVYETDYGTTERSLNFQYRDAGLEAILIPQP